VLARLYEAVGAGPVPVLTPRDIRSTIEDYWWEMPHVEKLVDPATGGFNYEAADKEAREVLVDFHGAEDGEDLALPSRVDADLAGGLPYRSWATPKVKVAITRRRLRKAGWDSDSAAKLARLLEGELPRRTEEARRLFKGLRSWGSGCGVVPVCITLTQESLYSMQITDDIVHDRINNGGSECSLRIVAAPQLNNLRWAAPHKHKPTKRRADAIRVMATYINFLSLVDQALVALRA
jgi:hypothetical protein